MTDTIEKLLLLQDREVALAKVTRDISRIPHEENQIDEKLARDSQNFEELKINSQKIEAKRKDLENDVKDLQGKIAKYRIQQFETKKNEEYQALGNEIQRAEEQIHKIEDEELELMEQYEASQKEVAAEQEKVKKQTQIAEEQKANLKRKRETLAERQKELKAELSEFEREVDSASLQRYRRILASKKDIAIVPIVNGKTCGGCHMQITTQTVFSVRAGSDLIPCEQCGRILYWPKDG